MFTLYRIASWGHKKVSGIVSRHQRDAASLRYREIAPKSPFRQKTVHLNYSKYNLKLIKNVRNSCINTEII